MKKNYFAKKAVSATMVFAVIAATFGAGTAVYAESETKVFTLGLPGQDNNYQVELGNVAIKEGYLEEELEAVGYELETVTFAGSGPAINEAIAGGSVDAGIYADFPIITANSNGVDTTIVATVNNSLRYGILAANGVEFSEPSDLEGKSVIVMAGTVLQYAWDAYVTQNDVDTSDINIINSTDASSLLATGDADFYVSTYSAIKLFESKGLGTIVDDVEFSDEQTPAGEYVNIKSSYLAENPDVAVAINKALLSAYDAVQENSGIFYADMASETYTEEIVKESYASDPVLENLNPELTDSVISNIQGIADYMYSNSFIASEVDAAKLADTSYYEQAVAQSAE